MPASLSVPKAFNGPLESGNGGYCAGLFAGVLDGPATVSLRRPVPLDTPLEVVPDDGFSRVVDGEATVAEVRPSDALDLDVPAPVGVEEAHAAAARYRGVADGVFSRCFVCGRAREDAFGVFAGAVEGRRLVASPWTPPASAADATGTVRPELVWAVLDCPTYFAAYLDDELGWGMLAQFTARIDAPVVAGAEHVVIGWPLAVDGRKRLAASAVLSAEGATLAVARALLIEPRREPSPSVHGQE